jgi:hypothetical protein
MKKMKVLLAVMLVAGSASAAVIWSESFSTNAPPTITYQNVNDAYVGPTRLHKPANEDWISLATSSATLEPWGLDGVLAIKDFNNSSRTTALLLDGATQLSGAGSETLTLNLKIAEANANYANVDVFVYEMLKNGTGATVGMKGDANVAALGGETVSFLNSLNLSSADTNSTRTLDFSYTSGADLMVVFQSKSGTADKTSWLRLDEVSVTSIPEPATLGLVVSFGMGVIFIRRRLQM